MRINKRIRGIMIVKSWYKISTICYNLCKTNKKRAAMNIFFKNLLKLQKIFSIIKNINENRKRISGKFLELIYRVIEKREYFKEENKMKKIICSCSVRSYGSFPWAHAEAARTHPQKQHPTTTNCMLVPRLVLHHMNICPVTK